MAPLPIDPNPDIPDEDYDPWLMMTPEERAGQRAELARYEQGQLEPTSVDDEAARRALRERLLNKDTEYGHITKKLLKLLKDAETNVPTATPARLAATRNFCETVLVLIADVTEAEREGWLTTTRKEMPVLHDSVLLQFATVDSPLAILMGKGEHREEHANDGVGGATAQLVGFVRTGVEAMGARLVLVDTSPFYSAEGTVSAGIGGGRRERLVPVAERRLMHTLLGALIAWHAALGGRVVLVRHMLSGIIAGDDKILKLNFPLLPKAAVAALHHCANVKVGPIGAPTVAVQGGYHWTVCWTRSAANEPLTFLRELAAALDPPAKGGGAGASASVGGLGSTPTDEDLGQANALSPRVLERFLGGVAAARDATVHATTPFAPFVAVALSEDAAHLIARGTTGGAESATALIRHAATSIYLKEVRHADRTTAQLKELLDTALET